MQHLFISDAQALEALCQQLEKADMLAIDTEFVRTRTLYPRLGLLQVSDGNVVALIDPITIDDLTPFWALMENPNILKLLHACSEDLEVFLHSGQCKPVNLIDTQIIMAFLGHGISVGYAFMVNHYLSIELDKSESRTDWTKRPLTEKQCTYASADVEYLFKLAPLLFSDIAQTPWLPAIKEESQKMIERKFTALNVNRLYLNVKMASKLSSVQLNRLQYLAAWRYDQAKKRDLPLSFIAKDNTLIALAQNNPNNMSDMSVIEGAEVLDIRHKGKAMLNVIKQASQAPSQEHPKRIERLDQYPGYKQAFKVVKSVLTVLAEQAELKIENVASKKQINQYLSFYYHINQVDEASVDLLNGWRKAITLGPLTELANKKFQTS